MKLSALVSTEALARASAKHPKLTIGLWVAILLAAGGAIAGLLSSALTSEAGFSNTPESKRGDLLLEERLTGPQRVTEIVIVRSTNGLTVDDAAFASRVQALYAQLTSLGSEVVVGGTNYYSARDESLVSQDRRTTIMPFVLAGNFDEAGDNVKEVLSVVQDANSQSGFRALVAGEASISNSYKEVAERDLRREIWGLAMAVVVLAIILAAFVATAIPLVLASVSIVIALGTVALLGQLFPFSFFVINMITMMGLAVGIDYSLFVLSRYREERARGLEKLEAIVAAGATANRAVFFSGLTVVLALAGMLLIPTTVFRSLAGGAMLVVIVSVLAALTLTPAILSLLGDRVNAWRIPFVGRRLTGQRREVRGGLLDWIVRVVMRHPAGSLVVFGGLLVAASIPAFDLNTGATGISTLPDRLETKQAFRILEDEFSFGLVTPAEVVIDGEVASPEVQAAIGRLETALATDPAFVGAPRLLANAQGDLSRLLVPVAGDPYEKQAIQAVRRLRADYVPQAFSGVPAEVFVTGNTAFSIDFLDLTSDYLPIVFAFVLGLSFVLLTLVFRSIVVPLKAVVMNLLSVGASYGLVVLVFQHGVGAGFFGFQQTSVIEAWIPLFLFSVLFGLSMDYHVFLLSRIRERYVQSRNNDEAVAFGVRTTAGIITGAALIMVAVFAGFASGELVMFQQVGFGLGVAVLLDATVVRIVLVPASMKLLGNWNWYLPGFLRWLPEVQAESAYGDVKTAPVLATAGSIPGREPERESKR